MKTLIAYFSWSGNTEKIAREIQKKTGADLFRIERETPYSTDYNTCAMDEAKPEWEQKQRPHIKKPLPDIAEYDAVIIAFPVWWYTFPMVIATFLESYDWSGKKIFVFANSYSDIPSQFDTSVKDTLACAKNAEVHEGLYNKQIIKLDEWLKENGF